MQLIKKVLAECPGFRPRATSFLCLPFTHWLYCIGAGISLQQYADDTQLHSSVSTDDLTVQLSALESCLHSLHSWLYRNGLALNGSKFESILLGISSRIRNFPPALDVAIAGSIVPLSDRIVALGVTLDSNLSFRHDVSKVCRSAHFHFHIRAALTDDMAKTVAVSLIHSRIDYANSHSRIH